MITWHVRDEIEPSQMAAFERFAGAELRTGGRTLWRASSRRGHVAAVWEPGGRLGRVPLMFSPHLHTHFLQATQDDRIRRGRRWFS
jgi:hypothetical protein